MTGQLAKAGQNNPAPAGAPALEVEKLAFSFAGRDVLRGVNLTIPAGSVLGVLGRSGSGKSTLLHVLMGLLQESAGVVRFNGNPVSAKQRRGQGGYVPQKPSLLPWRTVLDNLLLPLEVHSQRGPNDTARVLALLGRFGLRDAAGLWPHQLSGGMAQRIAVLRATLFSPELLFLDEPFSALDALTRLEFQRWLAELHAQTKPTTLLVTHDVREALSLCDQVVVLTGSPAGVAFQAANMPGLSNRLLDNELEAALLEALIPGLGLPGSDR